MESLETEREVPLELSGLKETVRAINETLESRANCFYCNEPASCEDHVIPHALLYHKGTKRKGYGIDTLPACTECNVLLSSHVHNTLELRIEALAKSVRSRYKRFEKKSYWLPSELERLAPGVKAIAEQFNYEKSTAEKRLAYLTTRAPIKEAFESEPRRTKDLWEGVSIEMGIRTLETRFRRARVFAIVDWLGRDCQFRLVSTKAYKEYCKNLGKRFLAV